MKYLKKYKAFELSENDESKVINDLIDIFSDISDYGLEVEVESVPGRRNIPKGMRSSVPDYDETDIILGDSINVSIHGIVGDDNLADFSLPTFKLGYVVDVVQRANDFLKSYSYRHQFPLIIPYIRFHLSSEAKSESFGCFVRW